MVAGVGLDMDVQPVPCYIYKTRSSANEQTRLCEQLAAYAVGSVEGRN